MEKKTYEKYRKKYSLPSYNSVNDELEISELESEDFVLRKIRRKISDRIDIAIDHIGSLLQPSADSLADMHECRFFSDKDKKKMIEIYKKLMIFNRINLEAEIEREDKKDAKIITDFFKEWPEIKKEILQFVKQMKTSWEKETEIEDKLAYFG